MSECCSINGCERGARSRGYCSTHLSRLYKHGDPLKVLPRSGTPKMTPERFWAKVAITANPDRCWEWQGCLKSTGYGVVSRNDVQWQAHRLAWFYVKGYDSPLWLLHRCDNPKCVNPNHLYEGTHAQNTRDAVERARYLRSEKHPQAKLTDERVREVKVLLRDGKQPAEVSRVTGVKRERVQSIKDGRNWRYVTI